MILSVKKISSSVTDKDLKDLFDKYGAKRIDLKENKETGKKFAFIDIPDGNKAKKAVQDLNGYELKGRLIRVMIKEEGTTQNKEPVKAEQKNEAQPQNKLPEKFPYEFFNRPPEKKPIEAFQDRLLDNHYDIAFEIIWETQTPSALNPCLDEEEPSCYPEINKDEYSGYNRRWLTIDNHLAISPFTVKSAIANGFANIMGGCYRVNTRIQGHWKLRPGQYPYIGSYKRYRVERACSKPGIVKKINILKNEDREIIIQPVKLHYSASKENPSNSQLVYYGLYRCGMNLELHKSRKHLFYEEKGDLVEGTIKAINFESKEVLKRNVVIGVPHKDNESPEWYQDLSDIKEGTLVYYEMFKGKVTNIGKNFLFKALFVHEDAVPEKSSECIDLAGDLCPRCRMFGMTDKTDKTLESIGFKGRFKSSTLINDREIFESPNFDYIRVNDQDLKKEIDRIPLKTWVDKETWELLATQELLPISGPPKPNRRDVDGYFNKTTGEIKGAKYYLHGTLNSARNIYNVDTDPNYTHSIRNYAQVARPHLRFTGTVGAENCNLEEIATFIILLHSDFSHHGFKIGLGKAFGMGSVKSYINRIWIRRKDDYENWHLVKKEDLSEEDLLKSLENSLNGITATHQGLKETVNNTIHIINNLDGMENRVLKYPGVGSKYWEMAFK